MGESMSDADSAAAGTPARQTKCGKPCQVNALYGPICGKPCTRPVDHGYERCECGCMDHAHGPTPPSIGTAPLGATADAKAAARTQAAQSSTALKRRAHH